MKIVDAIPLSVPKKIEGMFYWYSEYDFTKGSKNVILGHYHQEPSLLLYKDKVAGFLIKEGGFASHLAIVCRELEIPLYRYKNLDELVSGEYLVVIPKQVNVKIPNEYVWTLRKIFSNDVSLDEVLTTSMEICKELVSTFSKYMTVEKVAVYYDRKENPRESHIKIKVSNIKPFLDKVIQNPSWFMNEIENAEDYGTSFLCRFVAEVLIPYLFSKIGVENTLMSIRQHTPYWFNISKEYLKVRFGIGDEKISEYLKNLRSESKKKDVKVNSTYSPLIKLVSKCMEKYEYKNIRSFEY